MTNALPAEGADDPESRDAARLNAPLTVTTLGRIVSLSDYEDFARAFTGIGKARASELWRGERRAIHVTVAGPLGATIPAKTLGHLAAALERARDPGILVEIEPFARIFVRLRVEVLIDRRFESKPTIERIRATLAGSFDFERRSFGQALSASQVIAAVMRVPGLQDARVLALHPISDGVGEPANPVQDPILARLARWVGDTNEIAPAELVLLEPAGATVTERGS